MNFNFNLETPFRKSFKCGEAALGAALITGGTSLFNTFSQMQQNSSNQRFNRIENEKNRQFSSAEAQKQRDWQSSEWLKQFNLQADEWYKQLGATQEAQWQQYLRQAEYNTPQQQVRRLAEAGINPSAALSSGQGLVSASIGNMANAPSPSVPTGGAVSGAAASAPSVSSFNAPAPQVDLSAAGSFLANLGKAYKENEMMRPQIQELMSRIDNYLADTANKELVSEYQSLGNYIANLTKDAKVLQSWNDVKLSAAEIYLRQAQGRQVDAEVPLLKAQTFLNEIKGKCSEQELANLTFQVAHLSETYRNQQNLVKSQIVSNFAEANFKSIVAATEQKLQSFKVAHQKALSEYQFLLSESQRTQTAIDQLAAPERLTALKKELVNGALQSDILTDQARVALERAANDNDWFVFNQIFGAISGTLSVGITKKL